MYETIYETFVPKRLWFLFGKEMFLGKREFDKFIVHVELKEDIMCDSIFVIWEADTANQTIDVIQKEINLKKWDTLHFEYQIDVKFW